MYLLAQSKTYQTLHEKRSGGLGHGGFSFWIVISFFFSCGFQTSIFPDIADSQNSRFEIFRRQRRRTNSQIPRIWEYRNLGSNKSKN